MAEPATSLEPSALDRFSAVHRRWVALGAERLRLLAEVDRTRQWASMGATSCEAWLSDQHRIPWPEARRDLEAARALEEMPAARRALSSGRLGGTALRTLVEVRKADPMAFEASESELVQAATELPMRAFRRRAESWRASLEDAEAAERRRHASRRVDVGTTLDGMVRIEGLLDSENGQGIITALRAVIDASSVPGDRRTGPQRRADALGELCRGFLARRDRPTVGGERPVVTVRVDPAILSGAVGEADLEDAGRLSGEAARRMACDASVVRMVMGPGSEPLDVGRKTRVVPAGLRRAVESRDRHCRFPGCDRPPSWGEVHHVVHWGRGGRTAKDNLVLLCWRHHRAVHEDGFTVRMLAGRPAFTAPDGRALRQAERAPP